jgi:hypothetical protein|tara:strand:+ start:165 stop:299 length:135 start_codon:yes stop_codon:yes gene_type:complete
LAAELRQLFSLIALGKMDLKPKKAAGADSDDPQQLKYARQDSNL